MTRVKVCGLRSKEDIRVVNHLKPDYAGFVFAPSSRRLKEEQAKELIGMLNKDIRSVGVFVNEKKEVIEKLIESCRLDIIQLHGDESPEDCLGFSAEVWKALRVQDEKSISQMARYQVDAFVLDACREGTYGGTGQRFDWNLATQAGKYGRVFAAGGLNPENVREAVDRLDPYGVDVSSGVETEGKKDPEKIKGFIDEVRRSRV